MIAGLKKVGMKIDEAARQRMGWQDAKMVLTDGTQLYFFPVLAVSHGVMTAPTALLISGEKVVVIQAGTMALCRYEESDPKLCRDAKDGFFELLQRMRTEAVRR